MDWTGIVVKTPPAIEPVTVSELRDFLRLSGNDQDTMLTGFLAAARAALEVYTGRTFINTVYELYFDAFPSMIELARPPVQSVSSVYYINTSGVDTLLASTDYRVDVASLYGRIEPAYGTVWPSTQSVVNAVKVTFTAGYGTSSANVPAAIKEAIKMLAADIYEHPEANVELTLAENKTLKFLLGAYRLPVIA